MPVKFFVPSRAHSGQEGLFPGICTPGAILLLAGASFIAYWYTDCFFVCRFTFVVRLAFSVVVLLDHLCLRAFSFYISRAMLPTTALLLCYSHAGVASIAYGFSSANTLDAWFNPCYCTSHFMPESPVPFEATFATHLTCPPSASSTATSLLVASSPETMLCNLDSQLCPSPADAPFPHVPISHSVPLVPAPAVTAYGLQIEAANPCVPYDVPQFQSANNSTDGDTLAYNAAAALCVDHCRRRGKGSWIRDELYWNYLFSNKNCARVCSVFLGMVIPLGCLLLCLVATALIVGYMLAFCSTC